VYKIWFPRILQQDAEWRSRLIGRIQPKVSTGKLQHPVALFVKKLWSADYLLKGLGRWRRLSVNGNDR
jgi:hypothetical protein